MLPVICKQNEIDVSHLIDGKAGLPALGSRLSVGPQDTHSHQFEGEDPDFSIVCASRLGRIAIYSVEYFLTCMAGTAQVTEATSKRSVRSTQWSFHPTV